MLVIYHPTLFLQFLNTPLEISHFCQPPLHIHGPDADFEHKLIISRGDCGGGQVQLVLLRDSSGSVAVWMVLAVVFLREHPHKEAIKSDALFLRLDNSGLPGRFIPVWE